MNDAINHFLAVVSILHFIEFVAGAYPRPTLISGREASMGLHHPSELLARPYADQLAHQVFIREVLTMYTWPNE